MSESFRVDDEQFLSRALEATIRIALVALMIVWCFQILRPFIVPVVWGGIIAVAVYPLHVRVAALLGDRARLSAIALTLFALLLMLIPLGLFAGSMVESAQELTDRFNAGQLEVPPPPAGLATWPVVGEPLYGAWKRAASDLGETLRSVAPQLRAVGGWLLSAAGGFGAGVAQFIISLLIAGFFLASSSGSVGVIKRITNRLAGPEGERYSQLVSLTVRGVAVGILGVAFIQAGLIGVGFIAAGVPHSGLLILLCLGLGIVQLPATLIVLPVIIYVFSVESTGVAVIFTIWSLLAGASDNVLKPILLGRGAAVPMIVIFLGAIGGFLMSGFIGLFVGAVVLSLGYELARAWVVQNDAADPEGPAAPTGNSPAEAVT
jgi:predicted PurR-regulated permease PerM